MAKAIETGIPKNKNRTSCSKKAKIDNNEDIIVGINLNKLDHDDKSIEILEINNDKVRESQIKKIKNLEKEKR